MDCCDVKPEVPAAKAELVVALAGNPNSGKTTIFNALTGLRQKIANYPGVTVEKKTGRCRLPDGRRAAIIDLPGAYSLISRSPDERVATSVLRGLRADTPMPDVIVTVVDASNLQRNLYLLSQVIELGRPMVVALNMMDVARRRGIDISPQRLQGQLGVPVVGVVGNRREGIEQLREAIANACVAPMPDWSLPPIMKEELVLVGGALGIVGQRLPASTEAVAERLLVGDQSDDLRHLLGQAPVAEMLRGSNRRLAAAGVDPMQADIEAHYRWIDGVAAAALVPACERLIGAAHGPDDAPKPNLSERIDAILIHRFWGLIIFAAIMASLFVTIFWLAQPIMNGMQAGIVWIGQWLTRPLGNGPLHSLVNDGIIGGVGTIISFVPQIALLFMFLAILEDSGYSARAAFLMDKLLARVGLHGKSFIPLLSSFACAIPGIMATRTIESRRDRLATILIAPFMSCSARLPVYALLIGAFFSGSGAMVQAGIMLGCYALGIIAAVATAWFFRRSFLKGGATSFIMELPTYKIPQASQVARQVWTNAGQFVTKAGTTILAFSIVLWALAYYPRLPVDRANAIATDARQNAAAPAHMDGGAANGAEADAAKNAVAAAQSEYSLAGRIGHFIEPALRPLGFDWKMDVGLVGAFAAREVFVSTMGVTYAVGNPDETGTQSLAGAMQADHYANGRPVWTPLVAVSLLIWFVLALQCMSTVAIVRRETGGWGWPIFMLVYMNGLAYVVSLLVFQIGRHIGYA